MKKTVRNKLILAVLIIVGIAMLIWWSTKPKNLEPKGPKGAGQVFVVKVIHAQHKDMPVMIQELGSVEAEQSVNIISQVTGTLKKVNITQGQFVKAGQLLFEIDPAVYQSDLLQAQANLDRDQAQLALLKATASRYANLVKLEYITRQQYDEAMASAKEQEAVVAGDQAIVGEKKIQLSYTQIRAPISGKTGTINVHVGDLITANSSTPLVVINRLENVLIDFTIPQSRLRDLLTYQRAGTLKIDVLDENGNQLLAKGELAFVGNAVSGQTGTVQVKGKVANPQLVLWPGQLVTVRLIFTIQPKALVIPSISVQIGQNGHYVYVIKNNTAAIQPITISQEVGNETVITGGLQEEDSVIGEIPPGLQEGSHVKPEGSTVNNTAPQSNAPNSTSHKKRP